jgi:phage shock protein PspC (stress-responsive transcriptional regulator)/predicted membrane protein
MDADDRQQNGPEEQPTGPTEEHPTGAPEDQPTGPTQEQPGAEPPTGEQARADGPQAPAAEAQAAGGGDQPSRRLTRSREDRVIAGVCGGFARYFNVDPVFVRIAAVALAFVGGAGVLLYLAALLLMPSDERGPVVQASGEGRNRVLVIVAVGALLLVVWPFLLGGGLLLAGIGIPLALLVGLGVLVWWLVSGEGPSGDARDVARRAALGIGILVLSAIIFFGGIFATAAGPDWLIPAVVIAAGAAVVAGAFLKPIRWLVPPALALALAAGVVAAADIDLDGGVGDREYSPSSTVDLRDRYEIGVGQLVVDLRETDLPAGDVPLELDVGIGDAYVIVPEDVCVATSANVGIGNVRMFGQDNGGVDVDFEDLREAAPDVTRVVLDAEVGLGELRVNDITNDFDFRDGRFGRFEDRGFEDRDERAVCEGTVERASG